MQLNSVEITRTLWSTSPAYRTAVENSTQPNVLGINPLIKWPGGKRRLLPHILTLLPVVSGRYYEPFLGGAALYFRICPRKASLSDTNVDLINCYQQVRDNPEQIIKSLSALKNSEEDYYKVRCSNPTTDIDRACRFLYLTRLAFNGIYRVNRAGKFNVPYGQKLHLVPCDSEGIRRTSKALANARLDAVDFEVAVKEAKQGDTIYFDPPYTVAHGNNGFIKYNEKILQWEDQERLALLASKMAARGCHVFVSNADHVSVLRLYKGFNMKRIHRPSVMAASSKFRRHVTECLFYK